MKLPNLGEFKVLTLRETAEPLTLRETAEPLTLGDTPAAIYAYWLSHIASFERHNEDVESAYGFPLSARRKILGHFIISQGTLDTLLIHPREVFRPAILANADAIVLAHNHPSGDPSPSEADIKVTRDLIPAGQNLKIDLLDHLIIGATSTERPLPYVSLRELGYFYS